MPAFRDLFRADPWPWQATTPPRRQAEHAECGLAALAILMAHHGRPVPMAALRAASGDPRLGASLATLRRLARAEGFVATARRVEPAAFRTTALPALVHLRFIHFAVLEAVGPSGFRINDPGAGPLWLSAAEFDRDFTGLAMWLEAPAARPPRFPMLRVAQAWLRPAMPGLTAAAGLALAGALAVALGAWLAGEALGAAIARAAEPGTVAGGAGIGAGPPGGEALASGFRAAALPLLGAAGAGAVSLMLSAAGAGAVSLMLGAAARARANAALARAARHALRRTLAEAIATTRTALLRPGPAVARLAAGEMLASPALAGLVAGLPALLGLGAAALVLAPGPGLVLVLLLALSLALALLPGLWRASITAQHDPSSLPLEPFPLAGLQEPGLWKTGGQEEEVFARLAGSHAIETDEVLRAEAARRRLGVLAEALGVLRLLLPLGLGASGALAPGQAMTLAVLALAMEPSLRRLAQSFGVAGLAAALHRLADAPQRLAPASAGDAAPAAHPAAPAAIPSPAADPAVPAAAPMPATAPAASAATPPPSAGPAVPAATPPPAADPAASASAPPPVAAPAVPAATPPPAADPTASASAPPPVAALAVPAATLMPAAAPVTPPSAPAPVAAPGRSASATPERGLRATDLGWPAENPVLAAIGFHLAPGASLAITGPSGAGKTSLLRLAAGLIPPGQGCVTWAGRPTEALPAGAALMVTGAPFLPAAATLRETLCLGLPLTDARLLAVLERVGLREVLASRGGLDLVLSRGGAELSGGQRRRLALARALLRAPRLLLIDTALDAVEAPLAARLLAQLRAEGVTLLLATSRADIAARTDARLALAGPPAP